MTDESSTEPMIGIAETPIVAPDETLPTQIIDGDSDACGLDAHDDNPLMYQGLGAYESESQPFFAKGAS